MEFIKILKSNAPVNHYAVYVETDDDKMRYICDYINEDTPNAKKVNELGLTLRARLQRSKGGFAMLEGTIFNPHRLMDSIIDLKSFDFKKISGAEYKDGHTLLTVEADGCVNKYLIYCENTEKKLANKLRKLKK